MLTSQTLTLEPEVDEKKIKERDKVRDEVVSIMVFLSQHSATQARKNACWEGQFILVGDCCVGHAG